MNEALDIVDQLLTASSRNEGVAQLLSSSDILAAYTYARGCIDSVAQARACRSVQPSSSLSMKHDTRFTAKGTGLLYGTLVESVLSRLHSSIDTVHQVIAQVTFAVARRLKKIVAGPVSGLCGNGPIRRG